MNKIIFPIKNKQHYYDLHYKYVLNLFQYCNSEIEYQDLPEINETAFYCYFEGKKIIFDFSDNGNSVNENSFYPVFKFHYRNEHKIYTNIFPFVPISFYDWKQYNELEKNIEYKAAGNILYNQRAYGNAIARRQRVKNILQGLNVDFDIGDQLIYWNKINNCLLSVHVPGQNNNMIDRAQLQLMAFGCVTISPVLREVFPYYRGLYQPFQTYILCKDDYPDLIKIIDYYTNYDNEILKIISKNAKAMFKESCTPENLIYWIKECLKI